MIQLASHRLIGSAATALAILRVKETRLRAEGRALKVLLYGDKGTGKTEAALRFALELAGEPLNIDHVNGKEITLDFVRELKRRNAAPPLYGRACVLVADECDKMTADAKDLLLSVLDQMPAHCAFIGTSNINPTTDARIENARFQTRLHCIEVQAPLPAEIAALIAELHAGVPTHIAQTIAANCEGCVRSALIDAENFLDTQAALSEMAA